MKKIILVTGASSGFGFLTVKELLKQGHTVYAIARRLEKMKELETLGAKVFKVDITNYEEVNNLIKNIIKEDNRIDVLINNAGYGSYGMFESVSIEDAKKQFETNLFGLANVTKEVLPYMRENKFGKIINISSVVGGVAFPMLGWYSASKHAVEALSDSIRCEVKSFGIKVCLIKPGAIKTEFLDVASKVNKLEHDEVYNESVDGFISKFSKRYDKAPEASKVVRVIVKVIDKKNPKIRYLIGSDCRLAMFAKKILPFKITDSILRIMFGIK